jgi:RNA polymerase-binding transcription factor DksA
LRVVNLPAGEPEQPDDAPTEHAPPAATDAADPTHPATAADDTATGGASTIDLDRIERDLNGVEAALQRLDDGSYWTDETTGAPISDEVLAADPVARRATTER